MGKELTKQRTQEREEEAWRLRTTGLSQWAVAKQLGISQPAVSKILAKVGKRLAGEFLEEALAVKAVQTEILERIAAEALVAWHQSKKDAETLQTVRGRVGRDGEPLSDLVTRTITGQSGNPAHLAQARGALADIRSLWGLDSPATVALSGPGGGPITLSEVIVELPVIEAGAAGGAVSEPCSNGTRSPLSVVVDLPHE